MMEMEKVAMETVSGRFWCHHFLVSSICSPAPPVPPTLSKQGCGSDLHYAEAAPSPRLHTSVCRLAISKSGLPMDDHKLSPTTTVHDHCSISGKVRHSPTSIYQTLGDWR